LPDATVLPLASSRTRLVYIDALRGAAALGVVLYHTDAIHGVNRRLWWGDVTDAAMFFGKYGVWLFFVISGFCIHLQWVRSVVRADARPLGFREFWVRRIRRLYPPYLVTLLFYVLWRHAAGELPWTGLTAWKIGLHAFMLQNLDPRAMNAMNNVYWTLAVEEQLYLLYFVFLAIRQRWGWTAALMVGFGARLFWFALAMFIHRALGVDIVVTQAAAAQWGVWILGALSIEAAAGLITLPRWTRSRVLAAGLLSTAGVLAWAQNYWIGPGWLNHAIWFSIDVIWGAGFFVVVNRCAGAERRWSALGRVPRAAAWLAGAGLFSYSLYLTHEIVEWRIWPAIAARLAAGGYLLPQIVVAALMVVASLVFARAFFELFEKPFLSRPTPSLRRVPELVRP
jgi:peptidoglycan/LPS O-acetylase OafA/YrhL